MGRLFARFSVIFLVAVLTACATPRPPSSPQESPWRTSANFFAQQEADYQDLDSWRYMAKVGVTTAEGRDQASMDWSFVDQANSIRLYGPLGLGAVRIEFDDNGVVLADNKGVRHRGDNVQELLYQITGWPIPVDALTQWLFLLPNKDTTFRYRLNDQGQLQTLEQMGWSIDYADYKDYSGKLMPRKITATYIGSSSVNGSGADESQVKVRLISKRWQW